MFYGRDSNFIISCFRCSCSLLACRLCFRSHRWWGVRANGPRIGGCCGGQFCYSSSVLFITGASNTWPDVRLLGVLQRIALCYFCASLLFLHLDARSLFVAFLSLLIGYWAVMNFVPVPEIGAASFAQGANLANWIDEQYLPGLKLYGHWDPEGLLSTIPAIGTCLLGIFAGLFY
jgi:hypothetical protein